jgi:competence protein ComFC
MERRIAQILDYLKECLLSVIFSEEDKCIICSGYKAEDEYLCTRCTSKIKHCKEPFAIKQTNRTFYCYSAAYYKDVISELVIKLKYKNDFRAGEALGRLMVNTIAKEVNSFDFITFVPMSDKTKKSRGYNQSEYLSKTVSKILKIPCRSCLTKTKDTKDQIGLDGIMRWANLLDCYRAHDINRIKNKKILLVDDVVTTGATAFYCASELINMGAEEVTILTAAKSSI